MTQRPKDLEEAGFQLAMEIYDGRWNHVPDIHRKPAPACPELLEELERRCPGHSLPEYRQALADGLFAAR